MKSQDKDFSDCNSGIQLEKNISRLVMLANDSEKPGRVFTEALIDNALGELGRSDASGKREQADTIVAISQWEKAVAMIAVVCSAGFGILFTVLANVNSLLTGIILIAMFFNRLIYYGGLIL